VNLKEALLFAYGVIFATSTPYLKPKNRFLFPTATWKFDNDKFDSTLTLFLGGSGVCAQLRAGADVLIVNTNLAAAAEQWRSDLKTMGGFENPQLVLNSVNGVFGSLETIQALGPMRRIYAHAEIPDYLASLATLPIENISVETVLVIGGETVRLIPVNGCATESDLVVFFEKRSVMMFGSLFVNRIHPQLKMGVSIRSGKWLATLEELLTRFSPQVCIPSEGDAGDASDVREFMRYLKALTDPSIEFSYCRKNFDWMEIPSATSLEENFDILRRNVKTHTSMN
jgi:hypothetical protein